MMYRPVLFGSVMVISVCALDFATDLKEYEKFMEEMTKLLQGRSPGRSKTLLYGR